MTKTIGVAVTDEEEAFLKQKAREEGRSLSAFAYRALCKSVEGFEGVRRAAELAAQNKAVLPVKPVETQDLAVA